MSSSTSLFGRGARTLVVAVTALSALAASALAYADGIDISHWQGTVNWSKVRSDDVTFAFMKATEGTNYTDPSLARNWSGAESVGIYRAAYHFARPSTGTAAAQARYYVAKAGTFHDKGDLPPVLDLEVTGGLGPAALRTWVSTWLTTVEQLTGRTPILYFSPYFWIDHMGNSRAFTRYPLWIAHYTSTAPLVPGGWPTWTFWQRTSSGHVSGISGKVDLNRFNGSTAALAALARTTGGSTAPVVPGPTLPVGAATSLTMTPATSTPAAGQTVTFTGRLATTAPAAGVPNRAVSLWSRHTGGRWTQVSGATSSTTASGGYTLSTTVADTAAYQMRFAADSTYAAAASTPVRLVASARTATGVDLAKDHPTVVRGAALMVYGHLTAGSHGLAGGVVRYYKRFPGSTGAWTYVGRSTSLAPTGWHSLTIHPLVSRDWKAVYAGTSANAPATSTVLAVRVR